VRLLLLLLALLGPVLPAAAAPLAVSFQAQAEVKDSRVVLADIAKIWPAGPEADRVGQLPVATLSAPGARKELSTVAVITSLRHRPEVRDVDWQGSETIVVERAGQRLDQARLQAMLETWLGEQAERLDRGEVRLTAFRAPETLLLPPGELGWTITPSRSDLLGSSSFTIAFTVDSKPAGNCVVRGRLEALAEVVVAARALRRGDTIDADMLRLDKQRIDRLNGPFFATAELLGKEVTRAVGAGQPLEQAHIGAPAVIHGGDLVRIFARKGALNISTQGLARTDGRLGETIQVKNITSNKLIHCRVDGPGTVSVEF
jgi:flagella basal body P-ring formation protein FlgA